MAQQCFNHPMVKVKAVAYADIATILRFNHPMVKVKVGYDCMNLKAARFNHPMVKVKVNNAAPTLNPE